MTTLIASTGLLSSPLSSVIQVYPAWLYPTQIGRLYGPDQSITFVVALILIIGTLLGLLTIGILGKSYLELRRNRHYSAVRRSVRQSFYERLADSDPDWDPLVSSLSDVERRVLVDELARSTELLKGEKTADLSRLAESLELRDNAKSAIQSNSRYRRLWGLKLFIKFGWTADPEWLLNATSAHRDEREAAIRVLANSPDRVTRLAGVEMAFRFDGLSVYGMNALYLLVRDDPTPLLEQLDRQDLTHSTLLAQLLRILVQSDTFTGDAPMDGVLACLDHESAAVRRSACAALADYGWRPDVRDEVDLIISDLFEDPSTAVRISAYEMLGSWGDTAARAKLARAAESEAGSRALFVIARLLRGDAGLFLNRDSRRTLEDNFERWAEVGEIGSPHEVHLT